MVNGEGLLRSFRRNDEVFATKVVRWFFLKGKRLKCLDKDDMYFLCIFCECVNRICACSSTTVDRRECVMCMDQRKAVSVFFESVRIKVRETGRVYADECD